MDPNQTNLVNLKDLDDQIRRVVHQSDNVASKLDENIEIASRIDIDNT